MTTTIDSSRCVLHDGKGIIYYVDIMYDDTDVDLTNDVVEGLEVVLTEDFYSVYEGGKCFDHDMTEDVLSAIMSHLQDQDFTEDVLQHEYHTREPNFEMP